MSGLGSESFDDSIRLIVASQVRRNPSGKVKIAVFLEGVWCPIGLQFGLRSSRPDDPREIK
jgi:hypothetical protein